VGNLDVLQKLWGWAEKNLTTGERNNSLFLVKDNSGRTLWHVAEKEGTIEIFLNLWVWGIEKLSKRIKIVNN
jgi:hypothetical protein